MFEFLFKYPLSIYRQGTFIFLSGWPLWLMGLGILAAAAVLGFLIWRQGSGTSAMGVVRRASIWALQITLAALLLFLVWHPALSVSALKEQQNIVAVVIDDSSSMTTGDENSTRKEAVEKVLNGGLLKAELDKRRCLRGVIDGGIDASHPGFLDWGADEKSAQQTLAAILREDA